MCLIAVVADYEKSQLNLLLLLLLLLLLPLLML